MIASAFSTPTFWNVTDLRSHHDIASPPTKLESDVAVADESDDDDEEDIDATGPSTQDKIVDSLRASRRERARMLKLKAHEDGARHAAKQQGHLPVPLLAR